MASTPLVDDATDASTLMNIPLELRHRIFDFAAIKTSKPKKLIRYWFEKEEVNELIARAISANPTGPTPIAYYRPEEDSDSESDDDQDGKKVELISDDDDDDDGIDDDNMDSEEDDLDDEEILQVGTDIEINSEINNDLDSNIDDDEDATANYLAWGIHPTGPILSAGPMVSAEPIATTFLVSENDQDVDNGADTTDHDNAPAGPIMSAFPLVPANDEEIHDEAGDATIHNGQDAIQPAITTAQMNQADNLDSENQNNGIDTTNDGTVSGIDTATAQVVQVAQAQPVPVAQPPVFSPHHKWVHIPNFIRISHSPPPIQLLLTSKHLKKEALDWYYNVAVLSIDATGSFAHTSMFEESLNQITDADYSPMLNIRKVEVLFSWDTEWIRGTEGVMSDPFEAMLRLRAMHVVSILHRAPNLQDVLIRWYDSVQDNESTILKLDVLDTFDSLIANLRVEEHILEPGTKPYRRSIQGKRRLEFKSILDNGMYLN